MPTSELSNALNPYISQSRQRNSVADYSNSNHTLSFQPVVQPPQQHVPHVSELEIAISEPSPQPLQRTRQSAHVFTEVLRMVAATQNAHETERKRRIAWEQEQEAKYSQRQEEMERKVQEMSNEILALRVALNTAQSNPALPPIVTEHYDPPSILTHPTNGMAHPASPISPLSQPSLYQQPMFVQGSSDRPLSSSHQDSYYHPQTNSLTPQTQETADNQSLSSRTVQSSPQSFTPDPSPQLTFVASSRPSRASPALDSKRKRKARPSPEPVDDDGNSSASSSSSTSSRPRKRKSHHDTRSYTIHHAMRTHTLRVMELETDKELPDSHVEGTPLGPTEPVRFVWDKTSKQSVHNLRMKNRVLDDIKYHRDNLRFYKHVPKQDFNRTTLSNVFEQCFVTFRQKYKAQRDKLAALNLKQREDGKARKARHLSRRKIKLDNRADARQKLDTYHHVTFDGALQPECMSSEESDFEMDPETSQQNPILRTRGYAWRSTRLLRFYSILDDGERLDAGAKPKRGTGKRERRVGPVKEGFSLPPQGIAPWMVSRRWYNATVATQSDLPEILNKLLLDPGGFNWGHFHDLGDESEDEVQQGHEIQQQHQAHHQMPTFGPHLHSMSLAIPHQQYNPTTNTYMNYSL